MTDTDINADLPMIDHEIENEELKNFLQLHNARFIQDNSIFGVKLRAEQVEPVFKIEDGVSRFVEWQRISDYPFYLMFSPDFSIIRLEMYNTLLFPILAEQIGNQGYRVLSTGEDMELETIKTKHSTWFGWAHFQKQ